jgi:hypothetical protein
MLLRPRVETWRLLSRSFLGSAEHEAKPFRRLDWAGLGCWATGLGGAKDEADRAGREGGGRREGGEREYINP